ncbi:MAG: hypothetical protein R3B57_11545 [Phycisphaerales bacterium]
MGGGNENTLLEVYLRGKRVPCPSCSYNLQDLTFGDGAPVCPECGHPLHVLVSLQRNPGPPPRRSPRLERADKTLLKLSIVLVAVFALAAILLKLLA